MFLKHLEQCPAYHEAQGVMNKRPPTAGNPFAIRQTAALLWTPGRISVAAVNGTSIGAHAFLHYNSLAFGGKRRGGVEGNETLNFKTGKHVRELVSETNSCLHKEPEAPGGSIPPHSLGAPSWPSGTTDLPDSDLPL